MTLSKIEKDKIRCAVAAEMLCGFPKEIQYFILYKLREDIGYDHITDAEAAFHREYWIELFEANREKLKEMNKILAEKELTDKVTIIRRNIIDKKFNILLSKLEKEE